MNTFKKHDLVKIKNLKHEWIMAEVTNVTVSRLSVREIESGDTTVVFPRDVKDPFKQADNLFKTIEGISRKLNRKD